MSLYDCFSLVFFLLLWEDKSFFPTAHLHKSTITSVLCMWKHCAQVTGSAVWIFISIALNSALNFQGSNNFQHKVFCFQIWAIPLGRFILVAHYSKCGLLFHHVCVCVWGETPHILTVLWCIRHGAGARCSQSQHFSERNRELSHMQPHHKSNCNSQINCSVTLWGAPASLSHTPMCALVCVCAALYLLVGRGVWNHTCAVAMLISLNKSS